MKSFLLILLACICSLTGTAQTIEITGKVTGTEEADKFGIPSAFVLYKGAEKKVIGTVTNFDGDYKIKIPANDPTASLVFKSIGYADQTVTVGSKKVINVILKTEVKQTKEVVVTGFTVENPRNSVVTVTSVNIKEMEKAFVPSFDAALQGRAAGVQVSQAGGIPGGAVNVRIRGTGSISAGSSPLYIVDGIPITSGNGGDGGAGIGGGGVGYQLNPLADFNSNDIESITVLKDAASTAQYGSRGSNGVVIITTKKGKSGKTRFNLAYTTGFSNPTNKVKLLNGQEFLQVVDSAYRNTLYATPKNVTSGNYSRDKIGFDKNPSYVFQPTINQVTAQPNAWQKIQQTNTDWLDKALQTNARVQDLTFSGSGGSERTTFYLSGSYHRSEGNLKGVVFQRLGGRFNLDNVVTDVFKVGLSSAITYSVKELTPSGGSTAQGGFGGAQYRSLPNLPVFVPDSVTNYFPFNPYLNAYGLLNTKDYSGTNIELLNNKNYAAITNRVFRNISNIYADYKILPQLNFRSELGLDFYNSLDQSYTGRFVGLAQQASNEAAASMYDSRVYFVNVNTNNFLTYNKDLDENNNLNLLAGTSFQNSRSYSNGVGVESLPNDDTRLISAGKRNLSYSGSETQYSIVGYFAKANYKFKDRVLVQGNLRTDGSSRFGANAKYGLFWGGGLGYILSELDYFKRISWLTILKVRGSYGRTGNSAGLDNFQSLGLYNTGSNYFFLPGTSPQRIGNPNLTWEKADQLDLSVEYTLFKGRVDGSFTYFDKTSKDMLLALPIPPSNGLSDGKLYTNAGRLRNSGWEIAINTKNLVHPKFSWSTDFNISFIKNRVLDLAGLKPREVTGSLDFVSIEGQQLSSFYLPVFAGVDPQTGEELIYKAEYKDGVATGNLTNQVFRPKNNNQLDSNRVPILNKPVQPKFYGGITNNFRSGNFELSVLLTFQYGNYILDQGERQQAYYNGNNNMRENATTAWQKPGDLTNYPKIYYNNAQGVATDSTTALYAYNDPFRNRNTTRFLHDASYLRVKTVSLSYSLPARLCKAFHLSAAKVSAGVQNLFTFTKFPGWDPEVVSNQTSTSSSNLQQGQTTFDFPQVQTYTVGINLSF